jgi:hypothetical protein
MSYSTQKKKGEEKNRIYPEDLPIHRWYRFVLSYPPHLVRNYIDEFDITDEDKVLDPFCGTGTTVLECKKQGVPSLGFERMPVVHFGAQTKVNWDISPEGLVNHAENIAESTNDLLAEEEVNDDPIFEPLDKDTPELRKVGESKDRLLIKDSLNPKPMHKVLALQEVMRKNGDLRFLDHMRLALAKELVYTISNLRFGPEVGVSQKKKKEGDRPVVKPWLEAVRTMSEDLKEVHEKKDVPADVRLVDSRVLEQEIKPDSIDAVITSPPYPNEKDYSRTVRLESVMLGFMEDRDDLQTQKKGLIRSNTRGVYVDDEDDKWLEDYPRVKKLADRIEEKRKELGKTSGFEKYYHRVVRLYFGGMTKHLKDLREALRPGANLAYVVGDQASYFQIPIRTGEILADIADQIGYEVEEIELFRTRQATATQNELREEVVRLRWEG